jgi:dipeptidyl aminopeptidase/acylaminoacyl peptidase
MIWLFAGTLFITMLTLMRWAIHRSLAPERIVESRSPADAGLHHQDVRIPTENGKSIFGWIIPANQKAKVPAIVLLHGWGGNAETLLPLALPLHQAGFAVLLIDSRCHGRSDEDSFSSMPRFAEDIGHAIDWLKCRVDVDPNLIAMVGHSVGAAASLLAASRRDDIAAVVSIAAFTHPVAMMRRWFAAKGIPFLPIGWLMLRYVEWVIGHRFDDIAPINTIRRVRCPTLLVHGGEDITVPVSEAHAIHAVRMGKHVQLKVVVGSHDEYADLDLELPTLVDFLSSVVKNSHKANSKNSIS